MGIEGITNAQIIQRLKNVDATDDVSDSGSKVGQADEVNISNDARLAQTLNRAINAIEETSEVREGKISAVEERLESGYYESPEVLDQVAEQATQDLLGF